MAFESPSKLQRERAAALVIVLAFVVLLSGVLVAYLSRSLINRRLSDCSFHQAAVDELAKSALDIIVGNLKQEIVNGSQASTVGDTTLFTPNGNANMIPVRNGTPPIVSGTNPIPTLVRVSGTQAIALPGVDYAASNASTTTASANGRFISLACWNQHYLIPRDPAKYSGSKSKSLGTDPLPAFIAPSWVFVTNMGPTVLVSPDRSVIGRYAYAIYDEGALLDVNVAGYPFIPGSGIPASYALKGTLAFADLTVLKISGTNGVNNLVGWRNYASLQHQGTLDANFSFTTASTGTYEKVVLSNTAGFLSVSGTTWNGRTDQAFLSRQELIRFSRATGGSILPQDALQYLGTFSRAVTMPSWRPSASLGWPNGDLVNLRFSEAATVTHYRDDGTPATYAVKKGVPFLQKRFSLARVGWLTSQGPTTAVQACFGLQWDGTNRWNYVGPTVNTLQSSIETLDQVAAEKPPREPNFFEVLKAGILSESLNDHPGTGPYKDRQIIQIGANIITQSNAATSPTTIYFLFSEDPDQKWLNVCSGTENLPNPVAMNKYFRSVGELGYVYRDLSGHTLDFWTAGSADGALLDLFAANDNEPRVVAGQVNPNNAPAPVLQAIITGALKSNTNGQALTTGSTDALKVATPLVAKIIATPLGSRADLPALLVDPLKTVSAFATKPPGEAPLRALSSVTNIRTWNLMIDVIAQSGVFPPGAQTLDNFVVQGERRYWLHIAIDRFTGEVIDRQLEMVND